jgi:hypothetical protein
MSKILLKVPDKVPTTTAIEVNPETKEKTEVQQPITFLAQGNDFVELEPGKVVETSNRKFADWLIGNYEFTEVIDLSTSYPADFPNAKPFVAEGIDFESVKKMSREELLAVNGVGEVTANQVVAYFVIEGDAN